MDVFGVTRLPVWSLVFLLIATVLQCIPEQHALLYFNQEAIRAGEWWRLLSGHLVHVDHEHLLWNIAALLILGSIIESRSSGILLQGFLVGVVAINILLMTSFSELENYCGMSGVLNSLLVCALWLNWKRYRNWSILLTGVLSFGKILIEMIEGRALFTDIAWPPVAAVHMAGFAAGVMLILFHQALTSKRAFISGTGADLTVQTMHAGSAK